MGLAALVFGFTIGAQALNPWFLFVEPTYGNTLSKKAESLLPEKVEKLDKSIRYNIDTKDFRFNEGYTPSKGIGFGSGPGFSAVIPVNPKRPIEVTDPFNNTTINITPNFDLDDGQRDGNRFVYGIDGLNGAKVVSLSNVGYKEDIILSSSSKDKLEFSYTIDMPEGVEARLEIDGSIGFYGVRSELLGSVSTGSESDADLLESALKNGEKDNLLFSIPAPFVLEYGRSESVVDTFFKLEGNILTTVADNLKEASYPLSIDPSVYVETARKFMRGNNETNVEFDVDNELIQKASTTGARFDEWVSVQGLNGARFDGATATAGGYIYQVGGVSGSVGVPEIIYDTAGTSTFTVPTGVTSITVKAWGGGGGGGAGGSAGLGGAGGAGGYTTATLSVTPSETLSIDVGGGGGGGAFPGTSGGGGGGGGHSEVRRSGTVLALAPGGGGGGGGDNSSGGAIPGGDGGAGGDETGGNTGDSSGGAGGGQGADVAVGGAGGTGGQNTGAAGGSQTGGGGANGQTGTGGQNNGGFNNGNGDGGTADTGGWAGGGGGGGGLFGGGGGSSSQSGNNGGGGGGGGTGFADAGATSVTHTSGSGQTPGNSSDTDRAGAGDGGNGGSTSSSGSAGDDGLVYITYAGGGGNVVESSVQWINVDVSDGSLTSPNPGNGTCTGWCSESDYDLPDERRGHSLVAYNGFLYVIGGEDDTGARQDTVYIAKLGANGEPSLWHPTDPDKDNWVYWYEDTALSDAISYTAAVAYNNRLYILGGSTDAAPGGTSIVQYTDLEPTGTVAGWTSSGVLSLSTARFMHSAEIYNDYIYVLGGDSSASGSLLDSVEYVRLADDGTFSGSWEAAESFNTPRRTNGGDFATIYGAYIYIGGGCSSVSGGNCQAVGDEIQIASIFADGSLGEWSVMSNEQNDRVGYGMVAWQNNIYRIGGCDSIVTTSNECQVSLSGVDRGLINPPGEVSTVNISEATGSGQCVGATPSDCDLPDLGDGAGQGGGMLSATTILNGFLYVIGGCTNFGCTQSSGNVSYASVSADGSLSRPDSCVANGNTLADNGGGAGAWCVDSTRRVNGTSGISAAGITTFNNRIYLIGGIDETATGTQRIYYNSVNSDGSLDGTWEFDTFGTAGLTGEKAYTYAYARANPNSAGTNPGNLYVIGGCAAISASAGCASVYNTEVYKCNISTTGAVSGCTTAGQLQLDVELATEANQGLGLHSGTVYANYIYLIGGFSDNVGDRDTTFYARFDDNNNIVDVDSGTAILGNADDDWIESPNDLSVGRRRGWAFGYNGHVYAVGGYDAGGGGVGGVIPFIEWSKLNVSNGETNAYVTSSVTINQRWGLSMAVSNSFAYVVGGCDVGASPGGCSSFEPSVQTFQLYNNDSGAPAEYTESTGNFETNNSRIGSSAAILDGYIYVAGGETSGTINAASTTVQFAPLNANGTIGAWADTTASLPAARAYGQLEAAGGSLYYVGGEASGGAASADVYYATPTSGTPTDDVVRSTTYRISGAEFTADTYTLSLNNDLESDYFVMVAGADDSGNTSGPDHSQIRVDGDPFSNLGTTTGNDEILLRRGNATANWVGTVTVVECVSACATDGFELADVIDVNLPLNNTLTDVSISSSGVLPSGAHTSRTVPFGGYLGGGLSTAETNQNNFSATAGVRISKTGTDEIRIERQDNGVAALAGNAAAADATVYVVEWGSGWDVQEINFDDWNVGNSGVNATSEYTTQTITSVERDNTWVWKSPGTSDDNGLGDGAFGKVLTLGDGVNQNSSETTVALGSRWQVNPDDIRDDTVYIMEHSDLAVDYRFATESNKAAAFTQTVDAAVVSDTVSSVGNITSSEGYRIPLMYHSDSGTGTAYTRVAAWANYHSNDTTISFSKSYTGNSQAAWIQSVDFGNTAGDPGTVDITAWSTASNGLPSARREHSAAVWNDRIYVTGGTDGASNETNTIYISPQLSSGGDITSAWTTEAAGNEFEVERSGHTTITYANNLYVLGGIDDSGNYLNDVQFTQINSDGSLDPWTFTTSLPQYVQGADGFAANGFMYLIGGRSAVSTCTNNTYVAPISANTTIASGNNPTGVGEWYQTNVEFAGDRRDHAVAYNEGRVYVTGGGCASELTADQHYVGSLRSQPQVARYSYFVDADTNVFPTSWLLNGVDNDIGARWQFGYRSASDSSNVFLSESFTGANDVVLNGNIDSNFDSCFAVDGTGSASALFDNTYSVSSGTSAEFVADGDGSYAGCFDDTDDLTVRYDKFYVRPQAYGSLASPATIYTIADTTPSFEVVGAIRIAADGTLEIRDSTVTDETLTQLTPGEWHRIEVGTSDDQMTVRVYRDANFEGSVPDDEVTIALANASSSTFNQTRFGINTPITGDYIVNFDDFESSSTTWVGGPVKPWGQNTDFGDVTLGQVEEYVPLDEEGNNSNFARWYYVSIEIDASQTFGYPDDVTRGPTVDDMSIFFVSDPNKRLRHGKTFIQGLQQPLDTPCRQSLDQPNCQP